MQPKSMRRIVVAAHLFFTSLLLVGCPPPQQPSETPRLSVDTNQITIPAGASSANFRVWNDGGQQLQWTASATDGWITSISPGSGSSTGPNQRHTVTVTMDRSQWPDGSTGIITVTAGSQSEQIVVNVEPEPEPDPEPTREATYSGADLGRSGAVLTPVDALAHSDGHFAVIGFIEDATGAVGPFLAKFDDNLSLVWPQRFETGWFGAQDEVWLNSIAEDHGGNYLIAGYFRPRGGGEDDEEALLLSVDPVTGSVAWREEFPIQGGRAHATDAIPVSDGGYVVTGSHVFGWVRSPNIYLRKLDEDRNVEWSQFSVSPPNPARMDQMDSVVREASNGHFLVAAAWHRSGTGERGFVDRRDSSGSLLFREETTLLYPTLAEELSDGRIVTGGIQLHDTSEPVIGSFRVGIGTQVGAPSDAAVYGNSAIGLSHLVVRGDNTISLVVSDLGGNEVYFARVDPENLLQPIAEVTRSLPVAEFVLSIQETVTGGHFLTGWRDERLWLVRTNADGDGLAP